MNVKVKKKVFKKPEKLSIKAILKKNDDSQYL